MAAIEAGAEDIAVDDDVFEVITEPADFMAVRARARGGRASRSRPPRSSSGPKTLVEVDVETANKLMRLIDALEDNDDVDAVHANFDAPAEVLEQVAAAG